MTILKQAFNWLGIARKSAEKNLQHSHKTVNLVAESFAASAANGGLGCLRKVRFFYQVFDGSPWKTGWTLKWVRWVSAWRHAASPIA
jgi:hypothetical protein